MNQILFKKTNPYQKKKSKESTSRKKRIYKTQFFISIFLFFSTIIIYFNNLQKRNQQENISQKITSNYNISRLYNNENFINNAYNNNGKTFNIIGMIEIPKINIYYPIISESNDELLKISPCRIAGPMPNEYGNLCIAGHNYDNYKFFSKVSSLEINDEIIIYDITGNKLSYNIFDIYEVLATDLSPLDNSDTAKKQVTLVTCNNFTSNNRIIIKASVN